MSQSLEEQQAKAMTLQAKCAADKLSEFSNQAVEANDLIYHDSKISAGHAEYMFTAVVDGYPLLVKTNTLDERATVYLYKHKTKIKVNTVADLQAARKQIRQEAFWQLFPAFVFIPSLVFFILAINHA